MRSSYKVAPSVGETSGVLNNLKKQTFTLTTTALQVTFLTSPNLDETNSNNAKIMLKKVNQGDQSRGLLD